MTERHLLPCIAYNNSWSGWMVGKRWCHVWIIQKYWMSYESIAKITVTDSILPFGWLQCPTNNPRAIILKLDDPSPLPFILIIIVLALHWFMFRTWSSGIYINLFTLTPIRLQPTHLPSAHGSVNHVASQNFHGWITIIIIIMARHATICCLHFISLPVQIDWI